MVREVAIVGKVEVVVVIIVSVAEAVAVVNSTGNVDVLVEATLVSLLLPYLKFE